MASFNAESNKKDYEKIKSKPDKNEDRQNSVMKTKHEDEKNSRSNLKFSNSDLEEAPQNDSSSNPQSVTFVELRRLEQINGRSTRLVFKGIGDLPPAQEILNLDPHIVSVVEAKNRAPSCFCIFTDSRKKVAAEQKLDGARFRRGNIEVDKRRKMVPVDTDDLDVTREPLTLAVHGLARDVTALDLKKVFPAAKKMSIARRGGSAFLKYQDHNSAVKAFEKAEEISVKGCRVQVLFSHFIDKTRSKTNGSSKRDSLAISNQLSSSQSEKAPVKMDMKSLLSTLNGAGLKMDQLQKDYIRGGCEPGSGPDIRTAWMDHLKTNSSNKLSRSSRLDLVDNVWNFFDKDVDTQKRMKIEMENSGKNKMVELTQETREKPYRRMLEAVDKEIEKRNCRETKISSEYRPSPGRKKCGEWDYPSSPDKKRHHKDWPSYCSPDKKKHGVYVYPCSPERNRPRTRETSSSSSPERKKKYRKSIPAKVDSRRESRDKTSSDSSPRRSNTKMPSLKHCKRKIEYDSSSPSPPPDRNNTRRDASEKQQSGSELTFISNSKVQSTKEDKLEKQKKSKQASESDSDKSQDLEVNKVPNKSLKTTGNESFFVRIVEVKEGFTRMALVMAWRLGYNCEMGQEKCKAMASAMVAVWTNYGFSYTELKDMYATEKERDPDGGSEDVSFVELRKLLHKRLRKKVEDGHALPRKFNFSMLIDLTMFYFQKAT